MPVARTYTLLPTEMKPARGPLLEKNDRPETPKQVLM